MIECRALCERIPELEGMEAKEEWLPMSFDENTVESIKIAGPDPDEDLGGISEARCSTIYFRSGHIITVDIAYSKLQQQIWPKTQQQ